MRWSEKLLKVAVLIFCITLASAKIYLLMNIHHLDLLLKHLYNNRRYQYINEIHRGFNKIHELPVIDVLVLLNKLVKDGYVTEEQHIITTETPKAITHKEKKTTRSSYFISFEGVLFFESALIWKEQPYKWKQSKETLNSVWLVLKIVFIFFNAIAIIILTYIQATRSS
jgi:hypothetical protein